VQQRFSDHDVEAWAARVADLESSAGVLVGAAVHSVRAVPREALATVVSASVGRPLHVHLSEQQAENAACQAHYGCTPTELLADEGVLTDRTTAVHATHLSPRDVALLGSAGTAVCLCPTTERDLGDGLGMAADLADAGSPLCVGSDQNATIDLLEEARGVEAHERLRRHARGVFTPQQLVGLATNAAPIGWPDAGRLAVGCHADFVVLRDDTVRTAGCEAAQVPLVATAADVDTVVVDGRLVVSAGQHVLGDVAGLLEKAITPLWSAS
jgi:formiminoglutamate deiminase